MPFVENIRSIRIKGKITDKRSHSFKIFSLQFLDDNYLSKEIASIYLRFISYYGNAPPGNLDIQLLKKDGSNVLYVKLNIKELRSGDDLSIYYPLLQVPPYKKILLRYISCKCSLH